MSTTPSNDLSRSALNATSRSRPPVMLIAEARMAVEFLARAADWAAEVDRECVDEMAVIQRRLLDRIQPLLPPARALRPAPKSTLSHGERLRTSW